MPLELTADCARCAGLCCVAYAFDRGESFAFDKAAGERCRHLNRGCRCLIHHRLAAEGMSGCAHYDCHGAGQRATAMFADRDETPQLTRERLDVFLVLARTHELLVLLRAAMSLPLTPELEAERAALEARLFSITRRSNLDAIEPEIATLFTNVRFIAPLRNGRVALASA